MGKAPGRMRDHLPTGGCEKERARAPRPLTSLPTSSFPTLCCNHAYG